MEAEGSLPCSQQPASGSYPEPGDLTPHTHTNSLSLRSTLILSSHLHLGLPTGLSHSDCPAFLVSLSLFLMRATCQNNFKWLCQ